MTSLSIFGDTRTRVGVRHALIAPDGHVPSVLPGIEDATCIVLISPEMGAKFTQLLVSFSGAGVIRFPANDSEAFGYVVGGSVTLEISLEANRLETGHYFFLPARQSSKLAEPDEGTTVVFFFKRYSIQAGMAPPEIIVGQANQIPGQPYLGDESALLQTLLPCGPSFDMAVNIFNYEPGAHLPFVETHIMEHGLLMLEGRGIYRLEDFWYPVAEGDCIWIAPYCPQWFVAMGKTPARYLYYKDVNRPVFP
jgi:(S)-ureidoglycine aminohydrolase